MTPQMEASLAGRRVLLAGLLRIEFPGYTLRLCDGSATLMFDGEAYVGRDERFGVLHEMEAIAEEAGDSMPGLDLVLLPPSLSSAVDLSNPAMQGSSVRVWLAAVDPETGAIIPSPELLFAGEVDVPVLEVDRGTRMVAISVASVFERLMEPDEGARLSDSFHQWVWPGERGLENVTGTPIEKLWGPGQKPPAAAPAPQFPRSGVQQYL